MGEGKLVILAEVKRIEGKGWIENAKTDKYDRDHAEELRERPQQVASEGALS